ncbi:transposase [Actinosynnema sp. NPDC004786]
MGAVATSATCRREAGPSAEVEQTAVDRRHSAVGCRSVSRSATSRPSTGLGRPTVYGLFRRRQRAWVRQRVLIALQARAETDGADRVGRVGGFDDHAGTGTPVPAKGNPRVEPPDTSTSGTEPDDRGLGRSRGGWTSTLHLACGQGRRPLPLLLTTGQRGDSPQFTPVIEAIRVPRPGGGRARTRPDRVPADAAYSSEANRAYLRRRRYRPTPGPDRPPQGQGSTGGRPPAFGKEIYKQRHAVECGIDLFKQHRAWPRDTTSSPFATRPPSTSPPSTSGCATCKTRPRRGRPWRVGQGTAARAGLRQVVGAVREVV